MQIKLRYRKAFGLPYKMGLGNKDRFELNSVQIEEWLKNPQPTVLEKSVNKFSADEPEILADDSDLEHTNENAPKNEKSGAFENNNPVHISGNNVTTKKHPRVEIKSVNKPKHIGTLVTCNGFEPRALESFRRLVNSSEIEIDRILFIRYKSARSDKEYDNLDEEYNKILGDCKCEVIEVTTCKKDIIGMIDLNHGITLVDITGLQKSLIYWVIKHCAINMDNFYVAYTRAKQYMPTGEEIDSLLDKLHGVEADRIEALRSVPGGDLSGYIEEKLEPSIGDTSNRPVAIISPVSVKFRRVQELLENNEFDDIKLIVIKGEENNRLLEMEIAKNIQAGCNNSEIITVSEDPKDLIEKFIEIFNKKHSEGNSIVVSLTGTKIQAMVFAALSSFYNVEQCIYERPNKYDSKCSTGYDETSFFTVYNRM